MAAEQYLKRKERLLISAIRLLDEAGLAGLTTRELARREGISEPAVYRHYDGKVEVLLAVLNRFSEFDEVLENTVIENKMPPLDAIRHIIDTYASYYAGYPEITSVLYSVDVWKYDKALDLRLKEIMNHRQLLMQKLVDKAVEEGMLRNTDKSETLAELLSGIVGLATQQWRMRDMKYDLKSRIHEMVQIFLPETPYSAV